MWSNITKLWGKSKYNTINDDFVNMFMEGGQNVTKSQDIEQTDIILKETSIRDETPKECSIKLWPHQEAMLHRIRYIENAKYMCRTEHTAAASGRYMDKKGVPPSIDVCLGVMNDGPGSGKTYAILAAILTDNINIGATLIIVPQNIYGQWRHSIEIIFKNNLKQCKFSSSYADVMDIYSKPDSINSYKIILIQDSFAEAYLKVINDNNDNDKIKICRVVVDEVDIMDRFVSSSIKTRFVWLMSASYKDQKRLGPYHIGDHTQVICKCDSDFVAKSLNLPKPNNRIIECNDEHIQIFKDILEPKEILALNAGDLNILNRLMNKSGIITPHNIKDKIRLCIDYFYKKSEQLEENEIEYDRIRGLIFDNEMDEINCNILQDTISKLQKFRNHSQLLQNRLQSLPEIGELNVKEKYLQDEFIEKMARDKTSKWLFFNDNGNVLNKYQEFLLKNDIKAVMLDGGNQKLIEKTLSDYKEGDVQVLLLNSMIEGAGMNLENTTDLVFMHKTEEKFIQQVIGRAQRFGRKAPLNIIMLFNKNE